MKLIEKALVVILVLAALYSFDWHSWNSILISVLLCCAAANLLLLRPDSILQTKLKQRITIISYVLAALLIVRVLVSC